jgi:hypothetical protein
MKNLRKSLHILCAVVIISFIAGNVCFAQSSRTVKTTGTGKLSALGNSSKQGSSKGGEDSSKEGFRVKKFYALDKNTYVKSPKYDPTQQPSAGREKEWMQFSVVYDTSDDWIDSVVFQYYVLSEKMVEGKKRYSLFKKTVKYIDIAKGRAHISDVYLHPRVVERYGKVVAAGFEALIDGKEVGKDSKVEGINLTGDWWTKIADDDKVTIRDGYLLDRSESPFAMSNIDEYEIIKR